MRIQLLYLLAVSALAGCAGSSGAGMSYDRALDGSRFVEIRLSTLADGYWINWAGAKFDSYRIALPTKEAVSRTYAYSEVRLFDFKDHPETSSIGTEIPLRDGVVILNQSSRRVVVKLDTDQGPFKLNGRYTIEHWPGEHPTPWVPYSPIPVPN